MRPGQNKRMRGRPNNGGGGHRKGPNPLTRSYESNGPDVKIRGNAHHIAEKYLQLARDAQSSGDPVAAESYLQHAEHYFRLIASAQAAQAGYGRQPDAVDAEMDDDDDGIPDRFASPQPAAPAFVPQPQPYASERPPYNGGDRQPYGDRQNNGGGERQPYNGGDRQPYGDRPSNGERPANGFGQRQDRNNRRPYRDNGQGGEIRTDGGDRPANAGDRPDRQSRRERFAQERFERQERYAREQPQDAGQDAGAGEQPRIVEAAERPRTVEPAERPGEVAAPVARPERDAEPQPAARAESPPRAEPAPRDGDAPSLPSFITTPARVAPPEPVAEASAEPASTAFPGDGEEPVPKFLRRRRRTTRAAAEEPTEQPSPSGD